MAIAYRNAVGSNNAGGSGTITMTVPTSTANGDVLIMAIGVNPDGTTITDPAGWTRIGGASISFKCYWRIASSEPASYSVTISGTTNKATGVMIAISGAGTTTPVNGTDVTESGNASSATVTASALGTWTAVNGIDIFIGITLTGTTAAAPTNYTLDAQSTNSGGGAGSRSTSGVSHRVLSSVTTVGSLTATYGGAAVNTGFHVFIKEAAVTFIAAKPYQLNQSVNRSNTY